MDELEIEKIVKIIKNKLKEKKLKYQDLANMTSISLGTIKDIMRGQRNNPRLETITLILKALDINLDDDYKYVPQDIDENEVIMIGKGGEIQKYKIPNESKKAVQKMLEALKEE